MLGDGMWPPLPPPGGMWQRGVDEFWKDASLPNSWDLPSVSESRELRPVTVVTHGGHVPSIWDVSGNPL